MKMSQIVSIFMIMLFLLISNSCMQGGSSPKKTASASSGSVDDKDNNQEVVTAISEAMKDCDSATRLNDFSNCINSNFLLTDINLNLEKDSTGLKAPVRFTLNIENSGVVYNVEKGVLSCYGYKNKTTQLFYDSKTYNDIQIGDLYKLVYRNDRYYFEEGVDYKIKCLFKFKGFDGNQYGVEMTKDFHISFQDSGMAPVNPTDPNDSNTPRALISLNQIYVENLNGIQTLYADILNEGNTLFNKTGVVQCDYRKKTAASTSQYLNDPIVKTIVTAFTNVSLLPNVKKVTLLSNLNQLGTEGEYTAVCYLKDFSEISSAKYSAILVFPYSVVNYVASLDFETNCSCPQGETSGQSDIYYKCARSNDSTILDYNLACENTIQHDYPVRLTDIMRTATIGQYKISVACTCTVHNPVYNYVLTSSESCPLCLNPEDNPNNQTYKKYYQCKDDYDRVSFNNTCYDMIRNGIKNDSGFSTFLADEPNMRYVATFNCGGGIPSCVYQVERKTNYDTTCNPLCNESDRPSSSSKNLSYRCYRTIDNKNIYRDNDCIPLITTAESGNNSGTPKHNLSGRGDGYYEVPKTCDVPECYEGSFGACSHNTTLGSYSCKNEYLNNNAVCLKGDSYDDDVSCNNSVRGYNFKHCLSGGSTYLNFPLKVNGLQTFDQCSYAAKIRNFDFFSIHSYNDELEKGECFIGNDYTLGGVISDCPKDGRLLTVGRPDQDAVYQNADIITRGDGRFRECLKDTSGQTFEKVSMLSLDSCLSYQASFTPNYIGFSNYNDGTEKGDCTFYADLNFDYEPSDNCTLGENDTMVAGVDDSTALYCIDSCECAKDLATWESCTGKCGENCQGIAQYECPASSCVYNGGNLCNLVPGYRYCCFTWMNFDSSQNKCVLHLYGGGVIASDPFSAVIKTN